MTTYSASSIQEAVALAARFRDEGRYDLFRGQHRDWPVRSSLARLRPKQVAEADERLKIFFGWVQGHPELAALADRKDPRAVDQKLAVAQHYGLPTNFCDFTTDPSVAGFFASTDPADEPQGSSVIVCCRTRDLLEFCETYFPPGRPQPKLLSLSVPNLWRIEAQSGVFLFLPYPDFEEYYRFDRIEFPAGQYDGIDVDRIYPARRSPLEIALDEYFRFEVEQKRRAAILALAPDLRVVGIPDAVKMMDECFTDGDPGPHESWLEARPQWTAPVHETWVPGDRALPVDIGADFSLPPDVLRAAVLERVRSALAASPEVRSQPSSLVCTDPQYERIIGLFQLLWDGLRRLPYPDQDLAAAMGNIAFLAACLIEAFETETHSKGWAHVAAMLLDRPQMVEFGRTRGAAAAGYMDEADLVRALRPGFAGLLKPGYAHLAGQGVTVLQVVQAPSRAFVFDRFASLFAIQVAPTQVMLFRSKGHYFNAYQLDRFGLP